MKFAVSIALLAAGTMLGGCANDKKPAANSSVTDIRSGSTPPAVVQPIQPMQPIQPVVSDTPPVAANTAVASATPAITGSTYTVQKGDTLFKIARARYNDPTAVKKIKDANPGLDADHIKAGQKINLP